MKGASIAAVRSLAILVFSFLLSSASTAAILQTMPVAKRLPLPSPMQVPATTEHYATWTQ